MNDKNLVEMQIHELVSEGYYGNRSDAIRDIIRRGAVRVRARYPLHTGNENRKGTVEEEETVKKNLAPPLTIRCKHLYMKTTQYRIGREKC